MKLFISRHAQQNAMPVQKLIQDSRLSRVSDPAALLKDIESGFMKSSNYFKKLMPHPVDGYKHSVRYYNPHAENVVVKFCGFEFQSEDAKAAWYKTSAPG